MSAIIQVQNLSKSFILAHEGRERYTALRDVVADKAKRLLGGGRSAVAVADKEEFWALNGVNFSIEKGDRVGIIGRNGAGKSTLLKILSRITDPTHGTIKIKGRVASLLEVGTGFHPELTGRENIYLNGAILGMSRTEIKKKFDEIVAFAEIEKFLDTPVKRYSSGMYVRLAFAVAAHLEPEILVVDEVLAVGDAQFQKKCLGKMEDVSRNEGRTILFVSHQMDAVERITNKCIYLKGGKVAAMGDTSSIIKTYLHDYDSNTDIASFTNRMGTKKAQVCKLEIFQGGRKVSMIKQGELFDVTIGIKTDEPLLSDIAFVLENGREHPIFCTHLSDSDNTVVIDGYLEKTMRINVPYLRTGEYLTSITVFRPDKTEFYDSVQHFPLLTVEGADNTTFFPSDNRWGDLYFPVKWS